MRGIGRFTRAVGRADVTGIGSTRPGGEGLQDLYVTTRANVAGSGYMKTADDPSSASPPPKRGSLAPSPAGTRVVSR